MDVQDAKQLAEACKVRAEFCGFLASVYFKELTEEQIEALSRIEFECDDSLVSRGYARIADYLKYRDSGTRQDLAVDYARVFLGAGQYDKITAPPYESVFTSDDGLLMQDARDKALSYYRTFGYDLPEGNTIPEDHISFELQFAALLAEESARVLEAGDYDRFAELVALQRGFFLYHQKNWFPRFCDAVDTHAQTDFYRAIALITRGYLEEEAAFLDGAAELAGVQGDAGDLHPAWMDEELPEAVAV